MLETLVTIWLWLELLPWILCVTIIIGGIVWHRKLMWEYRGEAWKILRGRKDI